MKHLSTSDRLTDNYSDYYEAGDSEWRAIGAVDKANNILSLCNNLPHGSIIEIGAGEGSVIRRLSELRFGEEFYALEISSTGVDTIKNKGIPGLVECALFDGYTIPYDDNRFDIAVLTHVIEHAEYPRKLLYESSRVAQHLFVEVPLEDTIRQPVEFTFKKLGHINFYSPKSIIRLVRTCNLEILEHRIVNRSRDLYMYYYRGKKGLINYYVKRGSLWLSPALATRVFTYDLALTCHK